jgi:hypothetical protein
MTSKNFNHRHINPIKKSPTAKLTGGEKISTEEYTLHSKMLKEQKLVSKFSSTNSL